MKTGVRVAIVISILVTVMVAMWVINKNKRSESSGLPCYRVFRSGS
ncbi:MAG: hypothetical protein JNJ65_06650 [Cyclobacteriaceae bacterium]|nr:hypothetical protein [Cyclobacteriaceae bacterium]